MSLTGNNLLLQSLLVKGAETKASIKYIARSKLTPQMRHYLTMSKLHSDNDYKAKDAKKQNTNEFTKTFCEQAEYQIKKRSGFEIVRSHCLN